MSIFKTQKRTVLLQITCILLQFCIGHCEKMDVIITVKLSPNGSYLQASLLESQYKFFQESLFDNKTYSVTLSYEFLNNGNNPTISSIHKEVLDDLDMFLYFRCFVNQGNLSMKCIKYITCGNYGVNFCPNGFGISWTYEGECLTAKHFQNLTVHCAGDDNVTCYKLKNIYTPTGAVISQTTTSLNIVNNDYSTTVELNSKSMNTLKSTLISTVRSSDFTSTMFMKDYSKEGTPSDSTALIAGVIVGGVIACVIAVIAIVVYVKRKVKKEPASRRGETANTRLEVTGGSLGDSVYSNSKPTCRNVTNKDHFTHFNSNTNNYTQSIRKVNNLNSVPYSISGSDYAGVDTAQSTDVPLRLLVTNTDNDGYYNTININRGSSISRPVNQDGSHGNYSIEVNNSVVDKEHPASPQAEYSTGNKNVGYTNFNEIEQNKNRAAVDDYNNIKQDNITIGRNERAKNVYSKLRENVRHFEHTYGDVGVYMETGEDNSTVPP